LGVGESPEIAATAKSTGLSAPFAILLWKIRTHGKLESKVTRAIPPLIQTDARLVRMFEPVQFRLNSRKAARYAGENRGSLQLEESKMRCFRSVLALFGLSAALLAADPFVGTWKLNVEKSDFGNSRTAKSGSITYQANGMGYMYIASTVFGEAEVERLQIPVEFDGTAHEGRLGNRRATFVSKKIDDNSYELVFRDKETSVVTPTFRYIVSPQSNTLTFIWLSSGGGKPALTLVYDKE